MGYRIEYHDMSVKHEKKHAQMIKKWILVMACVFGIFAGIHVCGFQDAVLNFILPGDAAVTQSALSSMVVNIQEGQNAMEAFTDFCREIIDHAQME